MISIITIVKNDKGILDTLNALNDIKYKDGIETIVVDASEGKLDVIKERFRKVKWIYFKSKSKKRITIPEQRNLGIKNARGNPIVFIDANCVPQKNWLEQLTKPYTKDREKIVSGAARPFNENVVNTISNDRFKSNYLEEAPTINILFDKSVFKKIGYFDESFTFGSDTDLTWRAVRNGFKIRYAKDAIIYHNWGDFKEQTKRMLHYGSVRPKLYSKNLYKLKDILKGNNITSLIYPLFILFLPITIVFPLYPMLLLIPIFKNIHDNPIITTYFNLVFGLGVLKGLFNYK